MAHREPRHDDVDLLAARGKLGEDVATALGLGAQEHDVLVMGIGGLGIAHQLLGDDGDGGERRAETVRGRCSEPIERRQFLLAREHHLCRGKRLRHAPRFLCRTPRIEADEEDARDERCPHSHDIGEGKQQVRVMEPGQRMVEAREQRRQGDGHQAERGGDAQAQGRGRDRDRSDEQEGEGVLEPSGEIEQGRELKHVEAEHHEGIARLEPLARRVANAKHDIDPGRERDNREAPADWAGRCRSPNRRRSPSRSGRAPRASASARWSGA